MRDYTKLLRPNGEVQPAAHFEVHRPQLVRATGEQAWELSQDLDAFDLEAIKASGREPWETLYRFWSLATNRFSIVAGGRVLGMFGTWVPIPVRHLAEQGIRTPEAQFWFVLGSKFSGGTAVGSMHLVQHAARELLKYYDKLYGFIDARHERMIRLAAWLGGELEEPAPWGPKQAPFRRFTLRS